MKKIIPTAMLVITAAMLATPALAISRYNSLSLDCEKARATIVDEGAVILRYPSTRVHNMTLYDRYVRENSFCETHEYAERVTVPTSDNPKCPVLACKQQTDDDDLFLR